MNFCVTDGESVVVTRYISSKKDEAASLVRFCQAVVVPLLTFCFSGFHLGQNSVNMRKVVITRCLKLISEKILLWYESNPF